MNPPALYDTLRHAALAVDAASSGRNAQASSAWAKARASATLAFAPRTLGSSALDSILNAAALSSNWNPGYATLGQALNAASDACRTALAGNTASAGPALLDASGFAVGLPCRWAFQVILPAIAASRDEVAA